MFKKSMFILVMVFTFCVTQVFAEEDGEKLYGQNFCLKVDKYNVTKITSINFVEKNLINTNNKYTYPVVVVGYPSVPTLKGTFNGKAIGTDAMIPFKCPKNYANGASDAFNAGRIIRWYIPENYIIDGNNVLEMTINDKTASKSNIQK